MGQLRHFRPTHFLEFPPSAVRHTSPNIRPPTSSLRPASLPRSNSPQNASPSRHPYPGSARKSPSHLAGYESPLESPAPPSSAPAFCNRVTINVARGLTEQAIRTASASAFGTILFATSPAPKKIHRAQNLLHARLLFLPLHPLMAASTQSTDIPARKCSNQCNPL